MTSAFAIRAQPARAALCYTQMPRKAPSEACDLRGRVLFLGTARLEQPHRLILKALCLQIGSVRHKHANNKRLTDCVPHRWWCHLVTLSPTAACCVTSELESLWTVNRSLDKYTILNLARDKTASLFLPLYADSSEWAHCYCAGMFLMIYYIINNLIHPFIHPFTKKLFSLTCPPNQSHIMYDCRAACQGQ